MDQITESLLKGFAKEYELGSLTESKQFEHFCARAVVRREFGQAFDTFDVVVGDGEEDAKDTSDLGIDSVGVIVNNQLITDIDELHEMLDKVDSWEVTFVFIQSETSSKFETAKVQKFGFGVREFFKEAPALKKNSTLVPIAEVKAFLYDKGGPKFIRRNPICKLFYVTTGRLKGDDIAMNANMDDVKYALMDTGLFESVLFEAVGANALQELYHRSKNASRATFVFSKNITVSPEIPGVEQAYFGSLPWPEYRKLICDDSGNLNSGLFFDNIRDWQDYNPVNNEIKKTLLSSERTRFVLMNNGVTVIARELRQQGDRFTIEDYQIVNGCQTSHVLYDQRDSLDYSVGIPIRLICTKDEAVKTSIITATNRQTQVKAEQLYALEEFPKELEQYFNSFPPTKALHFERRDRQYERSGVEKTRVMSLPTVIRAFAAMFLNEPQRTTKNFKSLTAKVGNDIFAMGQKMEPYYVAAFALYKIEFMIRNGKLASEFRPARFHILMALRVRLAGYEMPQFTANKITTYCKKITDVLHDTVKCEGAITTAATLVQQAGGSLKRDDVRTDPYTDRVLVKLGVPLKKK